MNNQFHTLVLVCTECSKQEQTFGFNESPLLPDGWVITSKPRYGRVDEYLCPECISNKESKDLNILADKVLGKLSQTSPYSVFGIRFINNEDGSFGIETVRNGLGFDYHVETKEVSKEQIKMLYNWLKVKLRQ